MALAEARMWSNEDAECFYYQFWVAFQVESWESKFCSKGECPCHCHSFDQSKWEGELNLFREGGKHLSAVISDYNAQPNLFNVFECCPIKINLETTIRWRDPCNSIGGWGHSLGTLDTVHGGNPLKPVERLGVPARWGVPYCLLSVGSYKTKYSTRQLPLTPPCIVRLWHREITPWCLQRNEFSRMKILVWIPNLEKASSTPKVHVRPILHLPTVVTCVIL